MLMLTLRQSEDDVYTMAFGIDALSLYYCNDKVVGSYAMMLILLQ